MLGQKVSKTVILGQNVLKVVKNGHFSKNPVATQSENVTFSPDSEYDL